MNTQIETLITTAEKYIGVKESPANSNNVLFNTAYYGRAVSGSSYPWCMAFVWYVFRDAGLSPLFFGGSKTASCTTLMNWAKKQGRFHTSGYQRGDIVLFDFDNDRTKSEHVGIITGLTNAGVHTIEGNTAIGNDSNGGEVMRRTRNYNLIIGVFRPDFKPDPVLEDTVVKEVSENMTQDQFEAMFNIMMDKQSKLDVNPNIAPREFAEAIKAGITDGTRPQSPATRQEVAVMVSRLLGKDFNNENRLET